METGRVGQSETGWDRVGRESWEFSGGLAYTY